MRSEDVHSEDVNKAVEDEDQVMDFVTLGMFIIGMLTSLHVASVYLSVF